MSGYRKDVEYMKKLLTGLLAAVFALSLAGCGEENDLPTELNTDITFPITDSDITLTYWTPLNTKVTAFATSFSDVLCYQELEKATGIKIEFQHPSVGQEGEQFNLMMASKSLPDLIYYNWSSVSGGVDLYLEEGTILKLNDYIEDLAPSYNAILEQYPQAKRETQTDSGDIYMFPFLRTDEKLMFYKGLLIRQDWLDKLGLETPTTPDEWYTVLKAFKEKDPNGNGIADELPIVSKKMEAIETLINGFGASSDYIVKEGKVVYGPVQPEYKEALLYVNKLYSEGLIDPDFYLTDDNAMDAKVISNQAGSMYGALTSHMSKYMSMMQKENPNVSIAAVPSLRNSDGKTYIFNKLLSRCSTGNGTVITKDNKYVAESIKLLDYFYTDEGHMLANFGVIDDTYEIKDGEPVYTDKILHDPDGNAVGDVLARYVIAPTSGSFLQDPRYLDQILIYPEQKDAPAIWSKDVVTDMILPAVTFTSDEQTDYSAINNDITTYKDEMVNKFIIGTADLADFDEYVAAINSLGLEKALSIQQSAYDRYLSR